MTDVPMPGERFNFAQHLLARNARRPANTAYVDDLGRLSYGELAERIRRMAAALLASDLRREERVLLLMHDCNDWPVAFLGALYAGIVPVAVNTLLTADDYAYMLQHSRAQAALVSAALLPTLQAAMAAGPHELKSVIVSRPAGALPAGTADFEALLAGHAPAAAPAGTGPDDPASGSIRRARPGAPRARCTATPTRTGRPSSTARRCWACARATSVSRRPSCSSPTAWATR